MGVIQGVIALIKNRSLITRMTYKDLTDRYAGSALGLIWAFIYPLFLIALYVLIFTFVFRVNITAGDTPMRYAFYAICGLIPWISMAEGLMKTISSIFSKAALVKQAIFPIDILPVSAALTSLVPLTVGFILYILASIILMPNQITIFLLILPVIIFLQFLFTVGIGYFLAIGGVYFRDFSEIMTIVITIGMFVTPILYIEGMIPTPIAFLMNFNLIAHLIYMYRDVLFYSSINHPWSFLVFSVASILIFIFGYLAFKKVKHLFANVL